MVARIPRAMGTRVGVKRCGRGRRRRRRRGPVEVLFDLGHVPVGAARAVGRGVAEDLGGGEMRLERLTAPETPLASTALSPAGAASPPDERCESRLTAVTCNRARRCASRT